jgi:hypothetical protein
VTPTNPALNAAAMTTADVERLARNLIVERGFPCTLLSVTAAATGWNVLVRAGTGTLVRFAVSSQRPIAVRETIQETLEAAL